MEFIITLQTIKENNKTKYQLLGTNKSERDGLYEIWGY